MRAAQFSRYGPPEVLNIHTVARPAPRRSEVLVGLHASSVNPHDTIVRSGTLRLLTGRRFPLGTGVDFAGEIVTLGADVTDFVVGERVWGLVPPQRPHFTGSAAEFAVVPVDRIAALPPGLNFVEAASLVAVGTTALRGLRDACGVHPGERVLVRGAAGGVGSVAVQLARAMGAHVTTLSSARDLDFARSLGAEQALDYRTTPPESLPTFDVIFDAAGTDLERFRRRLAPGGRMATVAFGSPAALRAIVASAVFGPRRIRSFSGNPKRPLLDSLAGYVVAGALRPVIEGVYALDEIATAHRAQEAGGGRGKLVLNLMR